MSVNQIELLERLGNATKCMRPRRPMDAALLTPPASAGESDSRLASSSGPSRGSRTSSLLLHLPDNEPPPPLSARVPPPLSPLQTSAPPP